MHWIVLEREAPGAYDVPGVGVFMTGKPVQVETDTAELLIPDLIRDPSRRAKAGPGCAGFRLATPDEVPVPAATAPRKAPRAAGRAARVTQNLGRKRRARVEASQPPAPEAESEAPAASSEEE